MCACETERDSRKSKDREKILKGGKENKVEEVKKSTLRDRGRRRGGEKRRKEGRKIRERIVPVYSRV